MRNHPWHDLPWHRPSDQPDQIRFDKRPLRRLAAGEYARIAATTVVGVPLLAAAWLAGPARRTGAVPADFPGVAVQLPEDRDPGRIRDLWALVRELGVRRVLVRLHPWQRRHLSGDAGVIAELAAITGHPVVVGLAQDRACVVEPRHWRRWLAAVFSATASQVEAYQLLQAPNRTKWGCYHLGEALDLLEAAERVRAAFPAVRLAGPSIIDFEPAPALRLVLNRRRFRLDAVAAALYVDRRGAPENHQYGMFDLARKLRFQRAAADASGKCRSVDGARVPLWITETNWPLLGTGHWTPTSDDECVDETTQAEYLRRYVEIAWRSGCADRVYWWQLVAPGYGLVDAREGLRKRPAFVALQRLVRG